LFNTLACEILTDPEPEASSMSLYRIEFAYTPEAWQALTQNPTDRTESLRALLEQVGGKLLALYYAFGEYDGFLIFEVPDEVAATVGVVGAINAAQLRATRTIQLRTPDMLVASLRKAGSLRFRGPQASVERRSGGYAKWEAGRGRRLGDAGEVGNERSARDTQPGPRPLFHQWECVEEPVR
jgi:uncharacterized protein with GYD domain